MSIKCTHVAVQRGSIDISRLCACGANVVAPSVRDKRENGKEATNCKTVNIRHHTSLLLQAFHHHLNAGRRMTVWELNWTAWQYSTTNLTNKKCIYRLNHSLTNSTLGVRTALLRVTTTVLDLLPTFPAILYSHCFSHFWATFIDLNKTINERMNEWLADWLKD